MKCYKEKPHIAFEKKFFIKYFWTLKDFHLENISTLKIFNSNIWQIFSSDKSLALIIFQLWQFFNSDNFLALTNFQHWQIFSSDKFSALANFQLGKFSTRQIFNSANFQLGKFSARQVFSLTNFQLDKFSTFFLKNPILKNFEFRKLFQKVCKVYTWVSFSFF